MASAEENPFLTNISEYHSEGGFTIHESEQLRLKERLVYPLIWTGLLVAF